MHSLREVSSESAASPIPTLGFAGQPSGLGQDGGGSFASHSVITQAAKHGLGCGLAITCSRQSARPVPIIVTSQSHKPSKKTKCAQCSWTCGGSVSFGMNAGMQARRVASVSEAAQELIAADKGNITPLRRYTNRDLLRSRISESIQASRLTCLGRSSHTTSSGVAGRPFWSKSL